MHTALQVLIPLQSISDAATVTGTHSDDYSSSNTVKNGGQLLRLSMPKSKISLDKCHIAFEIMWAIFQICFDIAFLTIPVILQQTLFELFAPGLCSYGFPGTSQTVKSH